MQIRLHLYFLLIMHPFFTNYVSIIYNTYIRKENKMLNYLIVSSSLFSAQHLINNVLINNSKIRLYNISSSIYNAINILKINSNDIDIIILDIKSNKITKFLHLLEKLDKEEYNDSVIILTENNSRLYFKYNEHEYLQIQKNNNQMINNHIDEIVKTKTKKKKKLQSKNMAINYLNQLGYNFSHLGTKYLVEILSILLEENITKCPKLETIYSMIAKKYNTNSHNVKCVITLATKYMNENCKEENKKPFLPYLDNNYIYTKIVIRFFSLKYIHRK